MPFSILLVEDDSPFAGRLCAFLRKEGHHVDHVSTSEAGVRHVQREAPDVVLLDLHLPDVGGLETLELIKRTESSVIVVVMTAHASVQTAVEAMRLGALDYVTKPIDLEALSLKLDQAGQLLSLRSDLGYLLARERRADFESFVGECPGMLAVYERIRAVAGTDNTTVLVTGETGTGKELVARAVHAQSSRKDRPLMQIDCTALPLALLESELFGHERGAYTGADRAKKGLFEIANGGTLLLDEIGDMAPEIQNKFLRVLEERQFRRVGGTRDIRFDVRVVAATNQNLDALAKGPRFRSDLLYRLKVFEVRVPPLRERGDDIVAIAQSFVELFAQRFRRRVTGIDDQVRSALLSYSFPGNVRELRNIIEQAVILAPNELLTLDLLPFRDEFSAAAPPSAESTALGALSLDALGDTPLDAAERLLIEEALGRSNGNKKRAAELLGISRFKLQRRVEKLDIQVPAKSR